MTRKDVVKLAVEHKKPPYVPWDIVFSTAGQKKAAAYYGTNDVDALLQNHFMYVSSGITHFKDAGNGQLLDGFGVKWLRNMSEDVAMPQGLVLPEPTLTGCHFPDAKDPAYYSHIPAILGKYRDRFLIFAIGYTLFERAWTLRGMENLMIDIIEHPQFVHNLLDAITDVNMAQIEMALHYDFDCFHFGDDWGYQRGLFISKAHWMEFIYPRMKRMFDRVKKADKYISIHSCGDVHELFDDLICIGLNIANPFQPEAMDVHSLMKRYKGKLAFHGGLSTQQTLPYGTVDEVVAEAKKLLKAGAKGGYIFAPAHGVGGEVPIENISAIVELLHSQPGFKSKNT